MQQTNRTCSVNVVGRIHQRDTQSFVDDLLRTPFAESDVSKSCITTCREETLMPVPAPDGSAAFDKTGAIAACFAVECALHGALRVRCSPPELKDTACEFEEAWVHRAESR